MLEIPEESPLHSHIEDVHMGREVTDTACPFKPALSQTIKHPEFNTPEKLENFLKEKLFPALNKAIFQKLLSMVRKALKQRTGTILKEVVMLLLPTKL